MSGKYGFFLLLLLGSKAFGGVGTQSKIRQLYLLEDADHKRWCAFDKKSTWQSKVNKISAMWVAKVVYIDDYVSAVNITEEDQTGDWIVYDKYSLDKGVFRTLNRLINVLPEDRSVRQVFVIDSGKARGRTAIHTRLSTGKAITPATDLLPDIPVFTNIHALPFSVLMGDRRFEVWTKGELCM